MPCAFCFQNFRLNSAIRTAIFLIRHVSQILLPAPETHSLDPSIYEQRQGTLFHFDHLVVLNLKKSREINNLHSISSTDLRTRSSKLGMKRGPQALPTAPDNSTNRKSF